MTKYLQKALEIRKRLSPIVDSVKEREQMRVLGLSSEQQQSYSELALEVQMLFFSDSPNHPLYLKLREDEEENKRKSIIDSLPCARHYYRLLKYLDLYIQYRSFVDLDSPEP